MVTSPLSDTSMAGSHCSVSHSSQVSRNGPSAGTGVIPAATNASETRTSSSPTPLVSQNGHLPRFAGRADGSARRRLSRRAGLHWRPVLETAALRTSTVLPGGHIAPQRRTLVENRASCTCMSASTTKRRGRPRRRCGPGLGAFRRERGSESAQPRPTASRAGQPSVLPFSNAPRCASSVFSHRIGSWSLPSFEPPPLPTAPGWPTSRCA